MSDPVSFVLDIRFPDQAPQRVSVSGKLVIGSSEKSDVSIEEYGLSPMHLSFRVHNSVLSLHNLGGKNETHLGEQLLNHGKMYILNIGDELKLGDIEIIIRAEADSHEVSDEYKNLFENNDQVVSEESANEATEEISNINVEDIEEDLEEEVEAELKSDKAPVEKKFDFSNYSSEELSDEEDFEEEFDEDAEGEKSNFLTKVTSLFKIKQKKSNPRELKFDKANVKRTYSPAPGIFTRFFSFISKVCISISLVMEVFPLFEIDALLAPHFNKITKLLETIPYGHYLTNNLMQIVLVFIVLELLFSLLLGMGLPELLFGVRNEKSFLLSRVQAVLRTLISIVTTPLIIFDLPSIVKKRTLKEVLTGSRLSVPSKSLQIVGIFLFFPLFLLTPIVTPIILNLDSFKTINITEQRPIKIKKDHKIKRIWPSSSMKAKFSGKWDKRITILPTIKPFKKKVIPGVDFYQMEKKLKWLKVQYFTDFNILKSIKDNRDVNPMFAIHYPDLLENLNSKKSRDFSPAAFDQLKKVILNSLNLNFNDPLHLFINHGPFFKDLSALKSQLMGQLQVQPKSKISYYSTPKKFLLFSEYRSSKYYKIQVMVLNLKGQAIIYKSNSELKHANFAKKQVSNLFQNYKILKNTDTANSWDWSKTLDLLKTISETKKDITDLEIASVYDFFFENSLKVMNEGKELDKRKELLEKYSIYLVSIQTYLESLTEFTTLPKVSELVDSLNRLNQALKNKNLDFFSINP
ncbi:hypothetical protein A9Q84_02495 [Halobacteriovorax marinus]|uniref:FHA domain-containing protein n=1 Tax=Halobacteriovorax marinus TaxID=97084 RepID=A0A1Y5FCV1_9BACT|nr:hypothetical protein A9Q84_02495 [Halobacteriovorax marinus]